MTKSEFANHIVDLLSPYGYIKTRAMFGGYGVYKDSVIIGIIVNDELYFKVDNQSAEIYKSRGSKPFCYKARDKIISMSYWLVPLEIMEDELLLGSWLDGAYLVSLRTMNLKK